MMMEKRGFFVVLLVAVLFLAACQDSIVGKASGTASCTDGDGETASLDKQIISGSQVKKNGRPILDECINDRQINEQVCVQKKNGQLVKTGNLHETRKGECTGSAYCNKELRRCIEPVCGDGKLEYGEQCDDGNTDNTDWCVNGNIKCVKAICNDPDPANDATTNADIKVIVNGQTKQTFSDTCVDTSSTEAWQYDCKPKSAEGQTEKLASYGNKQVVSENNYIWKIKYSCESGYSCDKVKGVCVLPTPKGKVTSLTFDAAKKQLIAEAEPAVTSVQFTITPNMYEDSIKQTALVTGTSPFVLDLSVYDDLLYLTATAQDGDAAFLAVDLPSFVDCVVPDDIGGYCTSDTNTAVTPRKNICNGKPVIDKVESCTDQKDIFGVSKICQTMKNANQQVVASCETDCVLDTQIASCEKIGSYQPYALFSCAEKFSKKDWQYQSLTGLTNCEYPQACDKNKKRCEQVPVITDLVFTQVPEGGAKVTAVTEIGVTEVHFIAECRNTAWTKDPSAGTLPFITMENFTSIDNQFPFELSFTDALFGGKDCKEIRVFAKTNDEVFYSQQSSYSIVEQKNVLNGYFATTISEIFPCHEVQSGACEDKTAALPSKMKVLNFKNKCTGVSEIQEKIDCSQLIDNYVFQSMSCVGSGTAASCAPVCSPQQGKLLTCGTSTAGSWYRENTCPSNQGASSLWTQANYPVWKSCPEPTPTCALKLGTQGICQ